METMENEKHTEYNLISSLFFFNSGKLLTFLVTGVKFKQISNLNCTKHWVMIKQTSLFRIYSAVLYCFMAKRKK